MFGGLFVNVFFKKNHIPQIHILCTHRPSGVKSHPLVHSQLTLQVDEYRSRANELLAASNTLATDRVHLNNVMVEEAEQLETSDSDSVSPQEESVVGDSALITLGTGSAIPSKYRNGGFVFGCGDWHDSFENLS